MSETKLEVATSTDIILQPRTLDLVQKRVSSMIRDTKEIMSAIDAVESEIEGTTDEDLRQLKSAKSWSKSITTDAVKSTKASAEIVIDAIGARPLVDVYVEELSEIKTRSEKLTSTITDKIESLDKEFEDKRKGLIEELVKMEVGRCDWLKEDMSGRLCSSTMFRRSVTDSKVEAQLLDRIELADELISDRGLDVDEVLDLGKKHAWNQESMESTIEIRRLKALAAEKTNESFDESSAKYEVYQTQNGSSWSAVDKSKKKSSIAASIKDGENNSIDLSVQLDEAVDFDDFSEVVEAVLSKLSEISDNFSYRKDTK